MAQVYNRLTLDVKKKNHDIITAVQNDAASRYLDINLIDNGVNINLTGHEVRLYAKKPDQQEIFNNGQITNAEQGRVQIGLTSQLLAKEGYIEAQVITYKNNQQILSTLPFKIHVVSNLMSDNAIESSNEYGALVMLYQNLYEAMDQMTTMVQRIGTPGTVAQQNNLDTMFKVWEWMITYMKENGTAGLIDKINSIKNNTDLLTNSTYGLNALRNEIRNKMGDFWGRKVKFLNLRKELVANDNSWLYEKTIVELSGDKVISFWNVSGSNGDEGTWKLYLDDVLVYTSDNYTNSRQFNEKFKAPLFCNKIKVTFKRKSDKIIYQGYIEILATYFE